MGATSKHTSPAALPGAANNQQATELMTYRLPLTAYLRQPAGPIDGSGGPDKGPMTPPQQRTTVYGASKHGMNHACADTRRGHRQSTTQGNDTMFMEVIVASGDEDFHNMIVTRTYRRDDTLNAIDDDDGADLAHITSCLLYTSPSPRDRTRSRMPSSA